MTGKVFKESDNIYEDQAKVLCDYYLKAAEKIVAEEQNYEKKIEELQQEKEILSQSLAKVNIFKWVFAIFIIPFIIYTIKAGNLKKKIISVEDRIKEFKKLHSEIFRDYKVSKIGVAYVPIAEQVQYNNNSFIVDYTEQLQETEVKLQVSKQNDLLIKTIEDIKDLTTKAPIIEKSTEPEKLETSHYSKSMQSITQHDYFGKLERSLRTIKFCMSDMDITSVSLPLVGEHSEYYSNLNAFTTTELDSDALKINVFCFFRYFESIKYLH